MRMYVVRHLGIMLLVAVGGAVSGCNWLLGYGEEVAREQVSAGTPFEVTFTPQSDEPHQLWLAYDVAFQGEDFALQGPFEAAQDGETLGQWTLELATETGPVQGARSRRARNTVKILYEDRGTMKSTVRLVELPSLPAGHPVTIRGDWTTAPGTTANALELVVTD
ncbi:hypothetical protein [Haliangium sp.]